MTVPANVTRFLFEIPGLSETLRVTGFELEQGLSECFRCALEMACENAALDLPALIGKPGILTLFDASEPQTLHGVIALARQEASGRRFTTYCLELRPELFWLNYRSNLRIFQDKTVPDIVQQVLQDAGIQGNRVRLELTGQYPQRTYCTQFRETDLAFVERLLAEEGIFHFFEHSADRHTLVLADSNSSFKPLSGEPSVRYKPRTGMVASAESIYEFELLQRVRTGKVSLRDFNFEKSRLQLEQNAQAKTFSDLEDYAYPGHYLEPGEGKRYAGLRLQAHQHDATVIQGQSDCARLAAGKTFTLSAHPRADFNSTYNLTRVHMRGRQPQSLEENAGNEGTRFDVEFAGIPAGVIFRPPLRTQKPLAEGCQTAFVTGPAGEEIYTDPHGRIKIQFHWDRLGNFDETSSCWARVSQGWAGNQWGALVLPRIGQEVIVSFLHGDPDQPIVTGAVYNGVSPPPYPLPVHKTRSTFKTLSTPGGGGYHELRIEDKKGSEEIYLHAEKDVDLHVQNDWREWIGHERHRIVHGNQQESIRQDLHVSVAQNHNRNIGQTWSQDVGRDQQISIKGSCHEQAGRDISLKAGMQLVIEAGVELVLKVGGSLVKLDPSGVTIKGAMVRINSGGAALPASAAAPVAPLAAIAADSGDGPGQSSPPALTNRNAAGATSSGSATGGSTRQALSSSNTGVSLKEIEAAPTWVSIKMEDPQGNPVSNQDYVIVDKNGKEYRGTTDASGMARIQGLPQGDCEVSFPDSDPWKKG